jgi:hypothetical protein
MAGGGLCLGALSIDCQNDATAKITNISNQLYINKSTFNQLNEQLNEVIATTIVKNAVSSGGAFINKQEIKFKNISAKGDIEIGGINQKQTVAVTFDTMNKTTARNDAATQFIQKTVDALKNMSSVDVLTKMDATASAKIETGFLATGSGSSSTDTTNISNITSITDNVKNVSNILKNRVDNSFTTETVTSCIINVNNAQLFDVQDVKSETGNVRILNVTQEQTVKMMSKCGAITDATNKILTETLNALDIKLDETNSVVAVTDVKATADSTTINKGLFDMDPSVIFMVILAIIAIILIIGFGIYLITKPSISTRIGTGTGTGMSLVK